MKPALADLTPEYMRLFASCVIASVRLDEVDNLISQIVAHQPRYRTVEAATKVPWFIIAYIHNLECSLRFDQHLHNGDSLLHATHNDPARRPPGWDELPPAMKTWERSAQDALDYDGLDKIAVWDLPRICYEFETFNGFGYRAHGIVDPYLWAGSTHYTKGKYVSDHVFDANAVSQEIGTAVLLHRMCERGLVALEAVAV